MREILFRGKRIDNGEWVEGYYAKYKFANVSPVSERHYILPLIANTFLEVDPSTVGQYTGLTDKNGKRIFDGDIVEDDTIGVLGCVVFSTVGVPYFAMYDVHEGLQYYDCFWHDLEVIGTIHDNPELLKEETT